MKSPEAAARTTSTARGAEPAQPVDRFQLDPRVLVRQRIHKGLRGHAEDLTPVIGERAKSKGAHRAVSGRLEQRRVRVGAGQLRERENGRHA